PSGPPLHIQVFPLSARSLAVTFSPPALEARNGRIVGYYLGYKALDMDSNYMFKKLSINELSNAGNQQNEVNITSLSANTKYAVVVQAFNGKGTGPQSEEVYGQTLVMDRPSAPLLSQGDVGYDWIEIVWTFPSEANLTVALSQINGYYVFSKSHSSVWMERQIRIKTNAYTSNDLLCGTLYQYYVVAYNAMGKGDASDSIAIKTKGSTPVPPKHVNEFLMVNTTWAHIQLDAWHSNGCPIKEFLIRYRVTKYETEWSEVSA
ncbi:unnamed protein product, partial [Medioppia subpectinata]